MKKTTIASFITAGVSLCLFIASIFFVQWDINKVDATPSIIITSIFAFITALCAFILFAILFDKKKKVVLLIPTLALVVFMLVFTRGVADGAYATNSILDYLSPTTANPTLLAFLFAIAFVVCLFLYFLKNYKWAAIVVVAYIALLLIIAFAYTSRLLFGGAKLYIFITLGTLASLIALFIYFFDAFIANNEIEKKEKPVEEKVEAKPEATEEVKAEASEEKNEAVEAKDESTTDTAEEAKPEVEE